MRPTPDDLFPRPRDVSTAMATPPDSPVAGREVLTPAILLDRLARATTARQRLRDAAAALARAGDEDELLRDLPRQALRVVPADGAAVALIGAEHEVGLSEEYRRIATDGVPPLPLLASVARDASRAGQTIRDVRTHVDDDDRSATCGVIAVPLRVGTTPLGVLIVWTAGDAMPDVEDEDRLSTVGFAAAPALAHLRRTAQGEREHREVEALVDVARAAAASLRFG
ncbi:MAG: GAF domain-containing protein, partial [Gemmatimonadaceae bacterium]|nr:GAF domain-containing protein [Gemmatimonadaceae bacterium]